MPCRPVRVLACMLGVLVGPGLATGVGAQQLPPALPQGDEPGGPESTGDLSGLPLAGLQINASLGGGWDSNATFEPDGTDSATAFGQAGLTRTWLSPKWTTVANVGGGGSIYQLSTASSRYQLGGGLGTSGRLGAFTTLTLGGGGGVEYTDFLNDPATVGLALPLARSRRLQGQVGLTRALGARTQLVLSGDYGRYFFDSADLADSEGITATASLDRTLNSATSLGFGYGYQANEYDASGRSHTHTLFVGVDRTVTTRTSLSVSVGADRRNFEGINSRWIFAGEGAFDLQGRRTSLSFRVSRGVTPGPGLGQDRILNLFSVVLTSTLRPWATLTLTGAHGLNQDPIDPDLNYSTDSVDLGLSLRLSQTLSLAPQLRYRRRGEVNELPSVNTFRIGLVLGYARLLR